MASKFLSIEKLNKGRESATEAARKKIVKTKYGSKTKTPLSKSDVSNIAKSVTGKKLNSGTQKSSVRNAKNAVKATARIAATKNTLGKSDLRKKANKYGKSLKDY